MLSRVAFCGCRSGKTRYAASPSDQHMGIRRRPQPQPTETLELEHSKKIRCRIETIFVTWKRSDGLRRMWWQGSSNPALEVRLTAIAYNLKRTSMILATRPWNPIGRGKPIGPRHRVGGLRSTHRNCSTQPTTISDLSTHRRGNALRAQVSLSALPQFDPGPAVGQRQETACVRALMVMATIRRPAERIDGWLPGEGVKRDAAIVSPAT